MLFHYNGHGVPRPTANGEIWVFNKAYTQYIPLSIYDLQQWVGNPGIYVFDCSAAGMIVNSYRQFAQQRAKVGLLTYHATITITMAYAGYQKLLPVLKFESLRLLFESFPG